MSHQDYRRRAEEFMKILEKARPNGLDEEDITLRSVPQEKIERIASEIKSELEDVLRNVDITGGAKRFIGQLISSTYMFNFRITARKPRDQKYHVSSLDLFGVDLEENKYGFFDPRRAENVERTLLIFYREFSTRFSEERRHKFEGWINDWINEFQEKYGYDPIGK